MVKIKKAGVKPAVGKHQKKLSSSGGITKAKLKKPESTTKKITKTKTPVQRQFHSITAKVIESAVASTIKLAENHVKTKKSLLEDEKAIFLQITAVKVPKCAFRIVRLPLKHSLFTKSSEICLITPDVPHIGYKKHEQVIEHYEEHLKSKNVTNIKTIMPFHQLKTEYDTYELKRRLVELYDVFLVDGKVSGFVVHHLGNIFIRKRKLPIPVKLQSANLKLMVDNALLKTPLTLHSKGDSFLVQIGHTQMEPEKIADNTFSVLEALEKEFPGRWENIRNLQLKSTNTTAIPIYVTLKNKASVNEPVVKPKRPKAFKPIVGALSTRADADVTVLPSGKIVVKEGTLAVETSVGAEVTDEEDEDME